MLLKDKINLVNKNWINGFLRNTSNFLIIALNNIQPKIISYFSKWYVACLLPFILYFLYTMLFKIEPSNSTVFAIIGASFTLLKFKLDQKTYQKSLFEERFAIFNECDNILWCCFHDTNKDGQPTDWRLLSNMLDSFYRKSYFLFGEGTYAFLSEFRQHVLNHAFSRDSKDSAMKLEAEKFLSNLIGGQALSKHFKELKIDIY